MSTKIGTVQPPIRLGPSAWLAGLLAVLVGATVAVVAISFDRPEEASREVGVRGTAANTPTEVRGGFMTAPAAGGTLANTPSELSGGYAIVERIVPGRVANVQARQGGNPAAGRRASVAQPVELPAGLSLGVAPAAVSGTLANTPSELTGGILGQDVTARLASVEAGRNAAIVEAYERAWRSAQAADLPAGLTRGAVAPAVSGTLANTPSELTGGILGRSVAVRVSEVDALRAEAMVQAYERAWRAAQAAAFPFSVTGTGPGLVTVAEASSDTQSAIGRRGVTPRVRAASGEIVVNGEVCHQCQ